MKHYARNDIPNGLANQIGDVLADGASARIKAYCSTVFVHILWLCLDNFSGLAFPFVILPYRTILVEANDCACIEEALNQLGVLKGPVFWPVIRVIMLVRMFSLLRLEYQPVMFCLFVCLFVCLLIFFGHPKAFCTTISILFRGFCFYRYRNIYSIYQPRNSFNEIQ